MLKKSFTHEGIRYYVRGINDKDIAVKIALKKRALEDGTLIINKNTLVSAWANKWLEAYKKESIGEGTYELYKSNLKLHIIPEIGNLRLTDVKKLHLQRILNSRAGYSKSHILKIKQLLQQLFAEAKANKLLNENPAESLNMLKASDGTRRALTEEERKYITELVKTHPSGLWIKIMLYCGLRPQETAALQWRNINFVNKILTVDSASEALTNKITVPKSPAGNRDIPIPEELLKSLLEAKGKPFEYILTQQTTGRRHTKSSMRCLWSSFKRSLNIAMGVKVFRNELIPPFAVADDLVPYNFRHTYCTDLQSARVPINIARELMGHADISTTSKIYTHKSSESLEYAAELINSLNENKSKII